MTKCYICSSDITMCNSMGQIQPPSKNDGCYLCSICSDRLNRFLFDYNKKFLYSITYYDSIDSTYKTVHLKEKPTKKSNKKNKK